jgi:hypothetical protein
MRCTDTYFHRFVFFSKQAVDVAIKATERFLNDLRRDVGDRNFDRLFVISASEMERQLAQNAFAKGKRFRFFTPHLSARVQKDARILTKVKQFFRKLFRAIKSIFTGRIVEDDSINQPTYDLSDQGVNVKDVNNFRAAPYILEKEL